MKARVKATGEIVDVIPYNRDGFAYIQDDGETVYEFQELEILDDPDYWTRLEHQYAGMAMQGLLMNEHIYCGQDMSNALDAFISTNAAIIAQALVDELKEKEERK